MLLSSLEQKLERYRKRSKRLRSVESLKAHFAMKEAQGVTAWFE